MPSMCRKTVSVWEDESAIRTQLAADPITLYAREADAESIAEGTNNAAARWMGSALNGTLTICTPALCLETHTCWEKILFFLKEN